MATRRPKVPSAQYSAGAKKPVAGPGTTPDPDISSPGTSPEAHPPVTGVKGSVRAVRKAISDPHRSNGTAASRQGVGSHGQRPKASEDSNPESDSGYKPIPARSFNGRLLVLGLAMAAVTVALAPNIHTYVGQRQEISALQQDIAAQTAQQSTQQAELARWDDPAYVKQQARDRVSMLMPGETGYWVYGASAAVTSDAAAGGTPSTGSAGQSAKDATTVTAEPWVDSLWKAVEKSATTKPVAAKTSAGKPATKATPKPTAK